MDRTKTSYAKTMTPGISKIVTSKIKVKTSFEVNLILLFCLQLIGVHILRLLHSFQKKHCTSWESNPCLQWTMNWRRARKFTIFAHLLLLYKTRKFLVIMSIYFKFILALFIKSLNLRNIYCLKAVLVCTYVLSVSFGLVYS